jgi:hypothetical protein
VLTYRRSADYLPLAPPPAEGSTRLTLNEIGDTLAGPFAPLAFLWFFVPTWLQRTELKETRQVLADQQAELGRTANENADRTKIMQRQLETARSQTAFEEHRLRLYYLVAYILGKQSLRFAFSHEGEHGTPPLFLRIANFRFVWDGALVDMVLRQFGQTIGDIRKIRRRQLPRSKSNPAKQSSTTRGHRSPSCTTSETGTTIWSTLDPPELKWTPSTGTSTLQSGT